MNRKRFFTALLVGLLVLLAADRIHKGSARFIVGAGTLGYVLYGFWHYDKPWARRMLNTPKSWWMN